MEQLAPCLGAAARPAQPIICCCSALPHFLCLTAPMCAQRPPGTHLPLPLLPPRSLSQTWAVPDPGLRYAVRDAVADQVLPLYQAFFEKYRHAAYTGGCVRV